MGSKQHGISNGTVIDTYFWNEKIKKHLQEKFTISGRMRNTEESIYKMASSHTKTGGTDVSLKTNFMECQWKIANNWKPQEYYKSRKETLKMVKLIDEIEK